MKIKQTLATLVILFALFGVGSLVLWPSGQVGVDANGIAHGEPGHNHDEMNALLRERLLLQAEQNPGLIPAAAPAAPADKPRKIDDPAPVPEPKVKTNVSGCLRGYGEPGQCIPGSFPDAVGDPQPVTCTALADIFPKGFIAPKKDFAGLDPNGDGVACGPGDN